MAVELAARGRLGCYYSGYPKFKLPSKEPIPLRTHSLRTILSYAMMKYLPERRRPSSKTLFHWQDTDFDRWVGRNLMPCDFIHALPGQCLHTFERAKQLGIRTVLNHATGPVHEWVRIMKPEYARVGLNLTDVCPYDEDYLRRADREYELADFHCVASSVVRDQLIDLGVPPDIIWLVPYGADQRIFFHSTQPLPGEFRIMFAGQAGLRKDIRTLLKALELSRRADWGVHFYGAVLGESARDFADYQGRGPLKFHGPVSQPVLADAFRKSSVLVLPSLEEGFGLVVPQALNCGTPCIVSNRVGAKDLIKHRINGSIFEAGNAEALVQELEWWEQNGLRPTETYGWQMPAKTLLSLSQIA